MQFLGDVSALLLLAEYDSGRVGLHQVVAPGLRGDVLEDHLHVARPTVRRSRAGWRSGGTADVRPRCRRESARPGRRSADPSRRAVGRRESATRSVGSGPGRPPRVRSCPPTGQGSPAAEATVAPGTPRWADALVSTTNPSASTIRIGAWFESKRSRYMASALRWASREISARRRAARSADTRWPMRKARTSSSTTCMSSADGGHVLVGGTCGEEPRDGQDGHPTAGQQRPGEAVVEGGVDHRDERRGRAWRTRGPATWRRDGRPRWRPALMR